MRVGFIFMLFLFLNNLLIADKIEYSQAQNIAIKWMQKVAHKRAKIMQDKAYSIKSSKKRLTTSKDKPYYIFNLENGGWVIVADDDINSAVLAYSDKSSIDPYNLPPQFEWWLNSVANELKKAKYLAKKGRLLTKKTKVSKNIEPAYATSSYSEVGPLLKTAWGQGRGYNEYCPKDPRSIEGNGHVPAGCIAVAMAQIMNYFAWPPRGVGSNSYIPKSNPQYGRQYVNFGQTSYSWSDSQKAKVIYHAGVGVNMDYGPYASGAYITDANSAFRKYFRYKTSGVIKKGSAKDWHNRLVASLNRGSPVLYQGKGSIVHVFVCDGYKVVDGGYMYHFNWGWDGIGNGWFRVDNISPLNYNFNTNNYAIFDIYPSDPSYNLGVKNLSASISYFFSLFLLFGLLAIGALGSKQ